MRRACSQASNKTRQTTVFFGKVIDLFNEDPQEISHLYKKQVTSTIYLCTKPALVKKKKKDL